MNKYIKRIKNELIPFTTNAITTLELEENKLQKELEVHGEIFIKKEVEDMKTIINTIDDINCDIVDIYMDDEEGNVDKIYYELGETVGHWHYTIDFRKMTIKEYIERLKVLKKEMIGAVKKYENI